MSLSRRLVVLALVLAPACASSPAAAPPSPRDVNGAPPPTARHASDAPSPLPAPDAASEDAAIASAVREYVDLFADISPESATSLGLHTRDDALDDRTLAGQDRALEREEAMLRRLVARFGPSERARASAAARTDLAMITSALEVDIRTKRAERPLQRQPDVYVSPLGAVFAMTARDYAPAADRARHVVARLEKIPKVVDAAKENLRSPPRIWTEVGIDRAASAKSFLEAQRPFLSAALPGEQARIDAALKGAEAAYEEYKAFLQKQVLPRSNGRFAAGRELFAFLLAHDAFLDEGPDELLALGKKLFAETAAEMERVARRMDPRAKGWPEVAARVKKHHPPAEGLLDAYRTEVARARAFVVGQGAVELPPADDLEVMDTPPFLRSTITAAYDQAPPLDAPTKGFFFVTPIDAALPKPRQEELLREHAHGDLVDTAIHEAYPGHHLQLSFARQNPSLARKVLGPSIFAEGWALYSEELMAELGYYTDEERLLQLEWTLVRAARVIIDVGLHVGDMSFEQAVDLLTSEVHLERQLALSEVKRYTLSPTQPLSYLVGRQMIFRLRERYREREGARFSLGKFHTDLLTRGTVAPGLLAREIFGG